MAAPREATGAPNGFGHEALKGFQVPKTPSKRSGTRADHAAAIRHLSRRVRALAEELVATVQAVQEIEGRVGDLEVNEEEHRARR